VRPPVYIAGPFRGSGSEVVRNVQRACWLARYAVLLGRAPYVPHALGYLSVYMPLEGMEERALDCCLAMVHHIAGLEGAELWVILQDDGTPSAGSALELEAWDGPEPTCRTWVEWQREIASQTGVADGPR
jgi:hypothetical protein